MKFKFSKKIALIIAAVLLLTVAVGSTLAFIVDSTDPVENIFTPAKVSTAVIENNDEKEHSGETVNVSSKSDVQIKNTGNTDAYIRAAIVVTWKNSEGNVYGKLPELKADSGTSGDYTLDLNLSNDWIQGNDGFYYYTKAVSPNGTTEILISSCTAVKENAPDGYYLSVEILGSGIQSTPPEAVEEAWGGVSVSNDGTLIVGGGSQ